MQVLAYLSSSNFEGVDPWASSCDSWLTRGVRRSSSWEVPLSLSSNLCIPLRLLLGFPDKFISILTIDPDLISKLVEDGGSSPAGMSGGGEDDKIDSVSNVKLIVLCRWTPILVAELEILCTVGWLIEGGERLAVYLMCAAFWTAWFRFRLLACCWTVLGCFSTSNCIVWPSGGIIWPTYFPWFDSNKRRGHFSVRS